MTDIPFPMLTAPGQQPWVSGGRLVNCYPEQNPGNAGKPYSYWRVPGLDPWGTVPTGLFRGGIQVGNIFYGLYGSTVYAWTGSGPGVPLTGAIPGSGRVFWAANQNAPPDIVLVVPGIAVFVVNVAGTGMAAYPDAGVGTPNAVVYHRSFFVFTYGNGKSVVSNTDAAVTPPPTGINPLNYAFANSKPDALYRPIPLPNGQLLLCGSNTMEVWGGQNDTGYPFSWVSTIYRGIVGPFAIAGNDNGWGKGIYYVGDDNKVSSLSDYAPAPISTPDLDQLIEAVTDKTTISVGVYVSRGHGFVVVQCPAWCWEYDTTLQSWHERRSYLQTYWRGYAPVLAFGNWLCGDTKGPNLLKIDGTIRTEGGINHVQSIATTGGPTGGSFVLSYNGQNASPIAYNATAAQVQTALSSIAVLNGNISCAGGPLPAAVTVTFINALKKAPQPAFVLVTNGLSGGASVTMTQTIPGVLPDPLKMRIETGPMGAFPRTLRINEINVYMTKGASNALGHDPDETNAMIAISISKNGGLNWSNPRDVAIGRQAISGGMARSSIWGQADIQGVRWRFEESAGLNFAFMGADMAADVLR